MISVQRMNGFVVNIEIARIADVCRCSLFQTSFEVRNDGRCLFFSVLKEPDDHCFAKDKFYRESEIGTVIDNGMNVDVRLVFPYRWTIRGNFVRLRNAPHSSNVFYVFAHVAQFFRQSPDRSKRLYE